MKKIAVLLLVVAGFSGYSQNRKGQFELMNQEKHQLLVSFEIPEQTEEIYSYYYNSNQDFKSFVDAHNLQIKEAFTWNEEHFQSLRESAIKYSKTDEAVLVLKGMYVINNELPNEQLYQLAEQLERFSFVRYAELNALTPIQPPFIDIPPTTPNYFQNQGYIQADPGVNMQYVWNQGITGQGIRVRDVEFGMNVSHEELTDPKFSNQPSLSSAGDPSWIDHGTAVAGVVAAHDGAYGVTGMQHGIPEYKLFTEFTSAGYNRLLAINSAINQSVAGDVIMYELQTNGANSTSSSPNFVPAEYVNSVWDVTKAATDAGIHIVAAAGNGNQNLDSSSYSAYMNRGDSGALMVGAGSSTTTHSRLSFSTYGQRVNVHGWGENVLTTGYGTYSKIGNDSNQSYILFAGTSSATPVVASCVVALLARAKASNYDLSPAEIRTILVATGIAQGGDTTKPIGPLPDMQAAFNYLDNYLLSNNKIDAIPINVFPNPATSELFVTFPEQFADNELALFDTVGRKVLSLKNYTSNTPLHIATLKSGMYILKMKSNNAEQSKKIIIK
ncbi:S8 family peptidase [Paenimyroides aestuarii]|uniref:S8 family peptidase n=1 Tax=Paenimyroides aestuarii TaxID=2968490 RepID=A0ABY5NSI0_9FLAO|nr:S8 family peptidase [Paenimyroides aestuarii]UUV21516.1 S8 family peptidase [Paenimyroides aestuarii]